jgi:plastocyanin/predicted small lipoprotein YifL
MKKRYAALSLLVIFALMLLAGCGIKDAPDSATKKDRPGYVSKSDEGTITGKVVFLGTPPELEALNMTGDAACAASGDAKPDVIVINNGRLKNVFVYVKGAGVDDYRFPIGAAVTLDQKNCRYVPHVLGVQAGQILRITNSDQTDHNVHPTPKKNDDFNVSQVHGDAAIEHVFNNEEVMIPVQCNQHNWMRANIGVLDHPFFAVSNEDGSFTIKNVPPGAYTLVFWHEVYGEQSVPVKVTARGTVTQDVEYGPGTLGKPATFLRVGSPLIVP